MRALGCDRDAIMTLPKSDTCERILRMDRVPAASRPEIGSSKRMRLGLAASSTAIVILLPISNVFPVASRREPTSLWE